jgi:hypothetical protein
MFNFDRAIAEWRRQMAANGIKSFAVLDELESHLREDMEQQIHLGLSAKQAFEVAVQRMGQASELKAEFAKVGGTRPTLRARLVSIGCFASAAFLVLVGTWTLVSSDQVRPDGSKLKQFGANPKGINVFDANGRFFVMIASADNARIASKDPSSKTKSEEEGGLIVESIAFYGTYTVNEAENLIFLHLEASTFPNQIGTDQKRTITSLTADELKYSSPAATPGVQLHQVWKRAE